MATAQERIRNLMNGYDVSSSESDEIAQKIARSQAMNAALTKEQRVLLAKGLFDGDTSEDEENSAMRILRAAPRKDLQEILRSIGWPTLEDELDTADIAWLRGQTGDLKDFDFTGDDSDDIAEGIARDRASLQRFSLEDKITLIRALFDGNTVESQENAASKIFASMSDKELRFAIEMLTWPVIIGELDAAGIAPLIARTGDLAYFALLRKQAKASVFTSGDEDGVVRLLSRETEFLATLTRAQRRMLVNILFEGNTAEDEEQAAKRIILSEPTGEGLRKLCKELGWQRLFDELDGQEMQQIAAQLQIRIDSANAVLRARMPYLYRQLDAFEQKLGNSIDKELEKLPLAQRKSLINAVIDARTEILDQIASRFRRGIEFPAEDLRHAVDWLAKNVGYKIEALRQIYHETYYTKRIAKNLEEMDFGSIASDLPDMMNLRLSRSQRVAARDTFGRLGAEFRAAQELAEFRGDAATRVGLENFNNAKDAFLDHFDPDPAPKDAPGIFAAIMQRLLRSQKKVEADFQSLVRTTSAMADDLRKQISLDAIWGDADDDNARDFVSTLEPKRIDGRSVLARLSTDAKIKLGQSCLDGSTVDDDENCILTLFRATKKSDQAEFFQLFAGMVPSQIDESINGDEWDRFLALIP